MSRHQKQPSQGGSGTKSVSSFSSQIPSSLRTRRPSAAPKVSQPPQFGGPPPAVGSDTRRARAVSDKIKSRLSVRYADGPLPSYPPPPVPSLPSLPGSQRPTVVDGSSGGGGASAAPDAWAAPEDVGGWDNEGAGMAGLGAGTSDMGLRRDPGQVDLGEIGKDGFDPESYLKTKLAGASDAEIQAFVEALEKSKVATAEDLQKSVFKNYTEFITISREIATLETSLVELQTLLHDWKSVPESLSGLSSLADDASQRKSSSSSTTGGPAARDGGGNGSRRSSVADLQSLYRTQLQALYSQVAGSQKFIPMIPGRHVVAETGAFVELNPATYKAKGGVHLFLLDDLVLIAGVKRRPGGDDKKDGSRGGDDGRLIAEKCWQLAEVTVVDVKDSNELTHAIKIRRGKETLIFRTERPEDKRSLLVSFRKVAEELAARKRREIEKEQDKRRTLWQGGESFSAQGGSVPGLPGVPGGGPRSGRMSSSASAMDTGIDVGLSRASSLDGTRGKETRFVEEWMDEVTVALALKNWEEAVELIEEGKERLTGFVASEANDPVPAAMLRQRLAAQQDLLLTHLTAALRAPSIRKPALVTLVSYFYRLGQADLARSTFLAARTDVLRRRVGEVRWERGQTVQYINELAVVWFMGVSVTAQWYLHAFRENGMASGLVKWSKEQVDGFAGMFKEQVYVPDQDPAVIAEAVDVVRTLGRKLLYDIGLDLTFLFRDGLIDRRGSAASSVVPSRHPSPPPPPELPPPAGQLAQQAHVSAPAAPSTLGAQARAVNGGDDARSNASPPTAPAPQDASAPPSRPQRLSADRPTTPANSAVSAASTPPPRPPRRDRTRPAATQEPAEEPRQASRTMPAGPTNG